MVGECWSRCFGSWDGYRNVFSSRAQMIEFVDAEKALAYRSMETAIAECSRLHSAQKELRQGPEKRMLRLHMGANHASEFILEHWLELLRGCRVAEGTLFSKKTDVDTFNATATASEQEEVPVRLECEHCTSLWDILVFRYRNSVEKETKTHYIAALAAIRRVIRGALSYYEAEVVRAKAAGEDLGGDCNKKVSHSVNSARARDGNAILAILSSLEEDTCWKGGACSNEFELGVFEKCFV